MNLKSLQQFLIDSNTAGYAAGNEKQWIKEPNGSTTIPYQKNDWKSHDNFFGGEPYGGRLVIFFQDRPVWLMVYYGWVEKSADTDTVYPVLREALKNMPKTAPFRGPEKLVQGKYKYHNSWDGDIVRYSGTETIHLGKTQVYKASYMGG